MRTRALAAGLALSFVATSAAGMPLDPGRARTDASNLLHEEGAFCKKPKRPLNRHDRELCELATAAELAECDGFKKACDEEVTGAASHPSKPAPKTETPRISQALGAFGRVAVWLLVAVVLVVLFIPIVQALLRRRKDRALADAAPSSKPVAVVAEPPIEQLLLAEDPEELLRRADEHTRRGALDLALYTYLHAALRALDTRGAIRIARHRTNGEYVRGCKEPLSQDALRDIVRAVDVVQFGGRPADPQSVAEAASRAVAVVRARPMPSPAAPPVIATLALFVFAALLVGCGGSSGSGSGGHAARPSGNEIFTALLTRQGITVSPLGSSLANVPIPAAEEDDETLPAILVDTDRTQLDTETKEHLVRWVEAGGVLVLAGPVGGWPERTSFAYDAASSSEVDVPLPRAAPPRRYADDDDDFTPAAPAPAEHAHLLSPAALKVTSPTATVLATTKDGKTFAARRGLGNGAIVAIASDELLTNAQLSRPDNAAAIVTLMAHVDRADLEIATPEDAIAPPDNPISGLSRAGLGLATWHALAAAILLFLAVGVRLTRARPTPPPRRRAFAEHVEATGGFYARAGAANHALAAYARYAEERLRTKLPRGSSDPGALLASRSGAPAHECAALWQRAMAARSGDVPPQPDDLMVLKRLSVLVSAALRPEGEKA